MKTPIKIVSKTWDTGRVYASIKDADNVRTGINTMDEKGVDEIVLAVNCHADLVYVLTAIVRDLPTKKDWLDPDLERMARDILKKAGGQE